MSDQMRQLSDIKWQATGVDGHTHHTCGEWMYTSDAPPVEADEYERMKQRAEAAEAARDALALELAHLRPEWQAMRDERDAFESWSNTLESAGWQDAGFCPHCGKDDVRKSIDVLEPDAAKEIHYCCSCGRAWVIGHKQPTRV